MHHRQYSSLMPGMSPSVFVHRSSQMVHPEASFIRPSFDLCQFLGPGFNFLEGNNVIGLLTFDLRGDVLQCPPYTLLAIDIDRQDFER